MMRTEKLYETDGHLFVFRSVVTEITEIDGKPAVALAQTAFFPTGGGQACDTGTLGGVKVLQTAEVAGTVYHFVEASSSFSVGDEVVGEIAAAQRFSRMQAHSGEHIVSGVAHNLYGVENVGFHMDGLLMTVDFDRPLTKEQIDRIEQTANEVVYADVPVTAKTFSKEEAASIDYRSKKEFAGDVRIVTVEGVDRCACCAPHVSRTGEIGLIKILSCVSHRGGVRITLICGAEAYADYCDKYRQTLRIAALTASRHSETDQAVEALIAQNKELKNEIYAQKKRLCACIAAHAPASDGNLVVFAESCDPEELCEIALLLAEKAAGAAVACSGNDDDGYTYAVYCRGAAMNRHAKAINTALNGRGGGRDELIRGSFRASRSDIETFFRTFEVERP